MHSPRTRHAFTLIELLTVIAIIAILMGLLFPAMNSVKEAARKTQAKNDISQLIAAVKTYYGEYSRYPIDPKASTANDLTYGVKGVQPGNADIMNVLRAINKPQWNQNNEGNPRKIAFFEGADVKDPTSPKAGFDPTTGEFYDPWGEAYIIVLDANYDGVTQVKTGLNYSDLTWDTSTGSPGVRTGVVAGSTGKDRKVGTAGNLKFKGSDDVISWQN